MPHIEECCVLIPCHTLEDFPSTLSGCNAQGLLAAWSAPWHPGLIATTGKIPTWCRADVPPAASGGMYLLVPEVSESRLPHDFAEKYSDAQGVQTLRAGDRASFLSLFPLAELGASESPLEGGHRAVSADDFFALAYVFLQVQLMTRQLRYTSNLDEVFFSDVVVAAAKAWQGGDGQAAADSLHQAFDLLAQERDHYFSSDPHLLDLTLLAPTTLGDSLQSALEEPRPMNLLLDAALADRLAADKPELLASIRARFADGTLGLAGGAPDGRECLDHLTVAQIGRSLAAAQQHFVDTFGKAPDAFASYSGGIPADLAPWIAGLGYRGAIPIDFAAGSGYRDESKLLWHAGAAELEALVSKPIDAADDAEFLRLGATLGSAVDAGDVATALLVHWPGQSCSSYDDLRRAADWGLALGKFWTLGGYFSQGERPYHSFQSELISAEGHWLSSQVKNAVVDPLSSVAAAFGQQVVQESTAVLAAMADWVSGKKVDDDGGGASGPAADRLAAAMAAPNAGSPSAGSQTAGDKTVAAAGAVPVTLLNPHSIPLRVAAPLSGHPPHGKELSHVFASAALPGGKAVAFVDVPALGFATVRPGTQAPKRTWFGKSFGKQSKLADGNSMSNAFLDVVIGDDGSVASVHSGAVRGNRFSLQLCHYDASREPRYTRMQADRIKTTRSDGAVGEITCQGRIVHEDKSIGEFQVCYRIECGSRWLQAEGQIEIAKSFTLGPDPWRNYFAARCAVASEAARTKVLLRDKVHKVRGRLLNAPLGVLVDEADRQLLVLAGGRPAHRVCGARMLDTLLLVAGERDGHFHLHYGFDVKSPVAAARAVYSPPVVLERPSGAVTLPVGWLLQLDARNVALCEMRTEQVDGHWELVILLVETRGKSTKTRLHFYRNPRSAVRVHDQHAFECEEDAVKIVMGGHETMQLRVRF